MPDAARATIRRLLTILALASVLLPVAACAPSRADEPAPTPTTSATPTAAAGPITVRSLIEAGPEEPQLHVVGPAEPIAGERAEAVSYTSGGLDISGVVRWPAGDGPFPVVVAVHGSVDPDRYESGRDMVAEQRALLDAGFAVFAPDLRGYADSDAAADGALAIDPGFGWSTVLDWGMALDVVNALEVVRDGQLDGADPDRVGLLGHSMGGLLSLDAAVIAPDAADVVVALAAPASDLGHAIESALAPGDEEWALLEESIGTPESNPAFWEDVSPATFFDRATAPLLLIHGTADDVAPSAWAQETADRWNAAGGRAEVVLLDGADHHLEPRRAEASGIIVEAFRAALG